MKILLSRFIASVKASSDPLTTAIGLIAGYLYAADIALSDIILWANSLGPEECYRLGLGLLIAWVGDKAYKGESHENPVSPAPEG